MKHLIAAAALAALSIGTAAQADLGIDARQVNQQRQIDAGGRSGKLARRERDVLTAEQHRIKRIENSLRARHGGKLNGQDRYRINRMLDRAQGHISHAKRNRVRGPGL